MATPQEMLAEAKAVYHDWRLGKHARSYQDANGERVEYSVEAMRGLPVYIADLQRQVDKLAGVTTSNLGPLRPFFL